MTIGLEEDSRFYNGPLYDNREDASSKDEVKTSETKIQEKTQEPKLKTTQKTVKIETSPSKEETTFSYERDDE